METVLIALGSMVLYVVAYRTYGRYLGRRVFRVEPDRVPPSVEREDGVDFVPSKRSLVFGHHFTSIAGTGPIVGPAVAVVWGWVPALLWVTFGSIFIGAVHDFGSLIVSMRHRGRTIADLAGDVVNPRVRLLFLLIVLVALWIVLAIFGLVIAVVFAVFPSSVMPVWLQIPIAVGLGVWVRRGGSVMIGMAVSAVLMYATIAWSAGVDWANVWGQDMPLLPAGLTSVISPVAFWTLLLMMYVFVASVLPVQTLLQPRHLGRAVGAGASVKPDHSAARRRGRRARRHEQHDRHADQQLAKTTHGSPQSNLYATHGVTLRSATHRDQRAHRP